MIFNPKDAEIEELRAALTVVLDCFCAQISTPHWEIQNAKNLVEWNLAGAIKRNGGPVNGGHSRMHRTQPGESS